MLSSLIFLCKVFYFSWSPRAQAWTCLWHGLMLMWIFRAPQLHSCFSFPHVTPLCSTTHIFLFPTFQFYGKSHHLEQRVESSEQKAISLLLRMPQHLHLTHPPQLEHHQGEMLPHQAITLKLIHFNRADLKVTSESTDDIFKQVWRLHHGHPPHHGGCWGNQGQPRITSSSPGLPASISLPQTKAGGVHNECHWRDKHAPLHCLLSSGISSTRNVPHNKVFIPACNTSSFFSRACCAYHTEVLGGLITQCLQRALKIKCAK